jgi:hypothetical protein
MRTALLVTSCVLLPLVSAAAQANYTQLFPVTSPTPIRAGHVGVTNGVLKFVFGGNAGPVSGMQNDLWSFDGANWTNLAPSGTLPSIRQFHAGAFDTQRNRLVVFGGVDASSTYFADTWEWNPTTNTWANVTPVGGPSARRWAAMEYDAVGQRCILFGGNNNTTYYNDTWSWDGASWTQLSPGTSPSIRGRGLLSYDVSRQEMLYFGGRNSASALGDTWIFDCATDNWSQTVTAQAPGSLGFPGLYAYGLTYDQFRDRHVIFGGTRTGGTLADTWEFDGTNWEQRAASGPVSRTGCSLVYVPGQLKTYLWGGFQTTQLGDTWEYQTSQFPAIAPYGVGCTGPGGTLALVPDNLPWTGTTFSATATGLGPLSFGFAMVSLGQLFPGVPLVALPLPGPGVGCELYVASLDITAGLIPVAGAATYALALSSAAVDPTLPGLTFYLQVAELDFSAGWVGTYATNGLTCTIGGL